MRGERGRCHVLAGNSTYGGESVATQLVDRRGRPYTTMMLPELRIGRPPANAGQKYPAEVYTDSEVDQLIAACGRGPTGARNAAMIRTLQRTGVRCDELVSLGCRDVDLADLAVNVRRGKGSKQRRLGLAPDARDAIERWLVGRDRLEPGRRGPLFCTITKGLIGQPVQAPYFREALKRIGEKAGVQKRVHPHGFRHTFANNARRDGWDMVTIQFALGHADMRQTYRYVNHLHPGDVLDAMRGTSPAALGPAGAPAGELSATELVVLRRLAAALGLAA
jgi:integrase